MDGTHPSDGKRKRQRNGKLRIPLPFDEALRAAVEAKPPAESKRKSRRKKTAKR